MNTIKILRRSILCTAALAASLAGQAASAQVFITEWMYNGNGKTGEYIEFTNLGSNAVNFSGWSFDDDSGNPGSVSLTGFGVVNAGESVILTEATAAAFRSVWNLSSDVKVVGNNTNNLGRLDTINLYDSLGVLVDRLAYGDEEFDGTIRAQNRSGNPVDPSTLGAPYDSYGWIFASVGDDFGSYMEVNNPAGNVDIGNPGVYATAPVPLPAAAWLLISGLAGVFGVTRQKKNVA